MITEKLMHVVLCKKSNSIALIISKIKSVTAKRIIWSIATLSTTERGVTKINSTFMYILVLVVYDTVLGRF